MWARLGTGVPEFSILDILDFGLGNRPNCPRFSSLDSEARRIGRIVVQASRLQLQPGRPEK
jgi:hypothetical protein